MEIHVLGKSRVGDFPTPPGGGCLAPTKIIDKKKRFLKINSPMFEGRRKLEMAEINSKPDTSPSNHQKMHKICYLKK